MGSNRRGGSRFHPGDSHHRLSRQWLSHQRLTPCPPQHQDPAHSHPHSIAGIRFAAIISLMSLEKLRVLHCKEPKPVIGNKYFQKMNCAATVPISTFCEGSGIYIFPPLVCLFCCRKYVDRSWEYINRSKTCECRNWD
jgi:hypothetical protein